jgi:glycosyltransferase involved in cell wall biosynthesis
LSAGFGGREPRRIHIIGGPGTGKSTLARRLAARRGCSCYDLDTIAFEGPEFWERPLEARLADVAAIAATPDWITEGIWLGWTDELIKTADLIIWLDYVSGRSAVWRVLMRFVTTALMEARRQGLLRMTKRFSDYRRNLRLLLLTLRAVRAYYSASVKSTASRGVTRTATADFLTPYIGKLVHCRQADSVESLMAELAAPPSAYRGWSKPGPLVSIVVNNYNYARYLRAAIDSALAQWYPRTEVIVVDDGSTDESREVIAAYGDRVEVVLKDNGGQASAFNAGYARVRGDCVIFLDADDVLLPHTAGRVAAAFAAEPGLAKVMYRMEIIDERGARTGALKPPPYLPLRSGDLRQHVLTFPDDVARMATSGNAFSASVLRQVLPVPSRPDGHGADWYLSLVTCLFGPVRAIDNFVGACYRVHGQNFFEFSRLDLDRVRLAIDIMTFVHSHIRRLEERAGYGVFPQDPTQVTSVTYFAHRLISFKLDPKHHPITCDSITSLYAGGVLATSKRFDIALPMKAAFILWFTAMLLAPRQVAMWLADAFIFPEKRVRLNQLLGRMHVHS